MKPKIATLLSFITLLNLGICFLNVNAQVTFQKTYTGILGGMLEKTSDGGYIISGATNNFGPGLYDVYLIKTDAYGDILWIRTYGGASYDACGSVQQTLDGGYIIAGSTTSFGEGGMCAMFLCPDVYLIKTDANGDTLWTKTYGAGGLELGYSVLQTADGGYIVVGERGNLGGASRDVYLIKTDSIGNVIWSKTYGGTDYDGGYTIKETNDGGYIVSGYTTSFGSGDKDIYLIKTDVNGDTLWTKVLGDSIDDSGSAQQTIDGGYIIAGQKNFSVPPYVSAYLIKTDANGNSGCYQSNTNTIVSSITTVVGSGTMIDSGVIVNNTATIVSDTIVVDSVICYTPCILPISITISDVSCYGDSDGIVTTIINGGMLPYTYLWNSSDTIALSDSIANITGLSAGVYSIDVIDFNGCIAYDTITIAEPDVFNSSITSYDVSCNDGGNGTATVIPSGGASPYSYQWSDGQMTEIATGLLSGTYTVIVTDSCGDEINDTVIINEPPALSLPTGQSPDTVEAGVGIAWVTASGGTPPYEYMWDDPASQTTGIAYNLLAGSYNVVVTDYNGCEDSSSVTVGNYTAINQYLNNNQKFIIYSNPFIEEITIKFNRFVREDIKVRIFNVLGELVYDNNIRSNQDKINLSDLSGGIYLLQLEGDQIIRKKIIKL
ncbi:MAG: T9SS type A sorting domain-containing protein [Bacteroidota bacterium]